MEDGEERGWEWNGLPICYRPIKGSLKRAIKRSNQIIRGFLAGSLESIITFHEELESLDAELDAEAA